MSLKNWLFAKRSKTVSFQKPLKLEKPFITKITTPQPSRFEAFLERLQYSASNVDLTGVKNGLSKAADSAGELGRNANENLFKDVQEPRFELPDVGETKFEYPKI